MTIQPNRKSAPQDSMPARKRARWGHVCLLVLGSSLLQNACKKQDDGHPYGVDADGDGWPSELDCDDDDDSVFPGADEIVGDGIDQDCSGSDADEIGGEGGAGSTADECEGLDCGSGGEEGDGDSGGDGDGDETGSGGGSTRGIDADGDGYDAEPEGDDCDDDRLEIHPGAVEIPLNGVDENCDGSDLVGGGDLIFPAGEAARPLEPPVVARIDDDDEERYLVAWSDSRKAPGQDIYAQMVDGAGNLIGDEIGIEVSDNQKKTELFLATSGEDFFIVWTSADGIWSRQLDENGEPITENPFGFAPAGSVQPKAAHFDDHWAVVWKDGVELSGWVRTMRDDRARWEIIQVGGETVGSIAVAEAPSGFTVGWTGAVDETTQGIWLLNRDKKGISGGKQPVVALEGQYNDLQMSYDGSQLWLAFGVAKTLPFAATIPFSSSTLTPLVDTYVQLSTEVVSLNGLKLSAEAGFGPYAAWNDLRHATSQPSATAVYGNGALFSEDVNPAVDAFWNTARPVVVDTQVEVGGVSRGEDFALVSGLFEGKVFVLPVQL